MVSRLIEKENIGALESELGEDDTANEKRPGQLGADEGKAASATHRLRSPSESCLMGEVW